MFLCDVCDVCSFKIEEVLLLIYLFHLLLLHMLRPTVSGSVSMLIIKRCDLVFWHILIREISLWKCITSETLNECAIL